MGTHQHDPHRENEGASEDDLDVFKPCGSPVTIERRIAHAAEFSARQLARIAKAIEGRQADSVLLEIRDQLTTLREEIHAMSQELDNLTREVSETKTVSQSAITLLQGLAAKIEELKNDPVALQALADELETNEQAMANAITANTPAAPGGSPRPK